MSAERTPLHPDHTTTVHIMAAATATATAAMLSRARTADKVYELTANVLGLVHQDIERIVERTPPASRPACSAGCAFCCAIPVAVSAPEALYIAAWLHTTLSREDQAALLTRLRTRVEERWGWTVEARGARKRFCIFLREDERCGIYPIRPLACRGYNSTSRSACEEAFIDRGDRVPTHVAVRETAAGAIYGLILASKELGLEWGRHELEAAVLRALQTPDAARRWADGERVFAGCDQISIPAHVEQRLSELSRGSGRHGATS
jgi:Fe-S-cluster containining protein